MAASLKSLKIPHLIFGVGTYHYPNLRQSVSLLALDRIASHLKLEWRNSKEGAAQIAEGKGFMLVKPRTYQIKDNYKAMEYVMKRFPGSSVDHCTIVHHDLTIPAGTFQVGFAGRIGGNEGLQNGVRIFKTETFRKFGIGIAPPKEQQYQNVSFEIDDDTLDLLYTYNKMPQEERERIENEVLTDLDYLVDCLLTRHKIVRSDKKAIEVSQIQQLIRQTALRQKALQVAVEETRKGTSIDSEFDGVEMERDSDDLDTYSEE